MATRMQQRRGTAAQWTAANPILAAGEIGFETDTSKFKMGNGSSTWSALQYFANAAELAAIVDGAPGLLNTLNELAASIGDDPDFIGTVAAHTSDTTGVHGIADTSQLTTISGVNAAIAESRSDAAADATAKANAAMAAAALDASSKADSVGNAAALALSNHQSDTTGIHGIADTALLATKEYADNAVSTGVSVHNTDETNVHGIANTALLATKEYADNAVSAAVLALTPETIGLENVDNTTDANKPVSTAQATAISTAVSDHNAETENVHGIADTAELVTQTQLTNAISGATVDQSTLAGDGLVWDGANSEFDLDNTYITTATQTALDLKAPKADPTFTGTVSGVTKTHVGLANVDNTSDANKPVSTATQSALDLKANLASPTFTGTVTLPTGTVTSGMILDGTIVNADINASAAIALSKLATDPLARANHTGTQTASTISNFDTQVRTSKVTDLTAPTGSFSMNSQKITNLADPTADQDAATKAYVDAATAGLNVHASVKAATTANINLTNGVKNNDVLDGVTLATGNRILVKNQNTAADNGVYIVGAGAATRATDYDSTPEVDAGDFIFVEGGTVNGKTGWVQTNFISTIGTDAIAFTQFSGSGTYLANNGLTLTGNQFSINTAVTADLSTAQTLSNKTFVAPVLGAATATSINGTTIPSSRTLVTTADTGTVTSTMIADGAIVDADINASAAIAQSKISGLTSDLAAKAPLASPTFTGTVTVAANGVAFTDGTQTKAGVPSITTFASAISSSATLAAGEQDKFVPLTGAVTITLPATGYSTGQSIDFYQASGTGAQFASTNSVVGTPGLKFRTTNSVVTAMKTSAGWLVFGDLSA